MCPFEEELMSEKETKSNLHVTGQRKPPRILQVNAVLLVIMLDWASNPSSMSKTPTMKNSRIPLPI